MILAYLSSHHFLVTDTQCHPIALSVRQSKVKVIVTLQVYEALLLCQADA